MEDYIYWFLYGAFTSFIATILALVSLYYSFVDTIVLREVKNAASFEKRTENDKKEDKQTKEDLELLFRDYKDGITPSKQSIYPPSQNEIKNGGYFSLDSYASRGKSISREDKNKIRNFSALICNLPCEKAREIVEKEGYSIHVLYVGISSKMPLAEYSPKTIGVRIKDPQYDYKNKKESKYSIVTEIIDIGGVDNDDVGMIKL